MTCSHPHMDGTGEPRTWRCVGCGVVRREVDDPEGPVSIYGTGRRIRYVSEGWALKHRLLALLRQVGW